MASLPADRPRSARLIAILFLPLGLTAVAVLVTLPKRMNVVASDAAAERARGLAELMAALVAPDLEFEDRQQSRMALAQLAVESDFRSAVLYGEDRAPFAVWPDGAAAPHPSSAPVEGTVVHRHDDVIEVSAPVGARGGTTGVLVLVLGTEALAAQRRTNTAIAGVAALVVLVVGLAFSVLTARFLTRRQAAEEALRRSSESFVALAERLPVALVLHHEDHILYINPAGRSLLELGPGGPPGDARLSALLAAGEALPRANTAPHARLDPGVLTLATGGARHVEAASLPLQFGEKKAAALVAVDVTERKQMQERLLMSDRMASLGTLTAGVAHEINNPLAVVVSNVEMARRSIAEAAGAPLGDPADVLDALTDAHDAAQRVSRIVRDMKSLSRVDGDASGPVDLVQAIEKSLQMVQGHVKHRARIVRELAPVPAVIGNESRLVQVFVNLLINAAQALPEGHARDNQVVVSTGLAADGAVLAVVRDTGCGIPAAVRDRIFDPFFTTKPVGVGTGLGLAIVHSLLAAMGGGIQVDSSEGSGTTISVTLRAAPQAPVAASAAMTGPLPAGRRILVIDDEPAVVSALIRLLASLHEVTGVHSAAAALEQLAAGARFDLVLCDVRMPEMSGIELAELVRARHPDLFARFAFMTGDIGDAARSGVREAVDLASMAPVLEKPFSRADLLAFIDRQTGKEPRGSAAA